MGLSRLDPEIEEEALLFFELDTFGMSAAGFR
jgi:hypothetical protein